MQEVADGDRSVQLLVDGHDVAAASDDLHGEPPGEHGWQARFSRYGQARDQA
jgi:hypothetical protein